MYAPAWYVWGMVVVAVVGFALAVGFLLYRGGVAARVESREARTLGWTGLAVMIGLVVVNWALAGSGVYRRSPDSPIPWIAVVLIATIVGMLWVARRPVVASALDSPGGLVRLTLPHTLRIFGGVFLVAKAAGDLPSVFALPAGIGDMAVGVAAPFVAWQLARGRGSRGAVWFNLLGALDLVMALTLGFLTAPGLFQIIEASPTTEAVSLLPLALIPSVAVPTALTLHILSMRRLLSGQGSAPSGQPIVESGSADVSSTT